MNRRQLIMAAIKRKGPNAVTVYTRASEEWKEAIAEAMTLYPYPFRFTKKKRNADIVIQIVSQSAMHNPNALGEMGRKQMRIRDHVAPTPIIVCHEFTHYLFGPDHGPWADIRPCPHRIR